MASVNIQLSLFHHSFSGLGRVNTVQIKAMASDPDYALIKPSVSHVGSLLDKVVKLTCDAGKSTTYMYDNRVCLKIILLIR